LAGYVSQGRNYSPLFDVLGTRQAGLAPICPNGAAEPAGGCAIGDATPFTGLTDTQAYGSLGGRLTLEVKAARYVTFYISGGYQMLSRHLVTFADECNASVPSSVNGAPGSEPDVDAVGCDVSDTTPNPHYQPDIDRAGQRFGMGNVNHFDLLVRAQGTF